MSEKLYNTKEALTRLAEGAHRTHMHDNAAVEKTRAELLQTEATLMEKEVKEWREVFLHAALGSEPTSCIGQILLSHKAAYDKAVDRQRTQRLTFERAQKDAVVALEASFRIAAWRCVATLGFRPLVSRGASHTRPRINCIPARAPRILLGARPPCGGGTRISLVRRLQYHGKKQAAELVLEAKRATQSLMKMPQSGSYSQGTSIYSQGTSAATSLVPSTNTTPANLRPMIGPSTVVPATTIPEDAPAALLTRQSSRSVMQNDALPGSSSKRRRSTDEPLPWSCDDGLTAWAWTNQLNDVLEALTQLGKLPIAGGDETDLMLEPLLAHIATHDGAVAQQRVMWVLELADVLRMTNTQKRMDDDACELYELLNETVVPAEVRAPTARRQLARQCVCAAARRMSSLVCLHVAV